MRMESIQNPKFWIICFAFKHPNYTDGGSDTQNVVLDYTGSGDDS